MGFTFTELGGKDSILFFTRIENYLRKDVYKKEVNLASPKGIS